MEFEYITAKKAKDIISNRVPHGLFICKYPDGYLIGIDNEDGYAWTEEFCDELVCQAWLNGEVEYSDLHDYAAKIGMNPSEITIEHLNEFIH